MKYSILILFILIFYFIEIFVEFEKKCKLVHQKLKALNNYTVTGIDISPVKHLRLSFENSLENLEKIVDYVRLCFIIFK